MGGWHLPSMFGSAPHTTAHHSTAAMAKGLLQGLTGIEQQAHP